MNFSLYVLLGKPFVKKKLLKCFLCATWHIFPLKLLREKNKRLGQISHEKVKLGSHFPQGFFVTLSKGKVFKKIARA
jgi:hypothetical protein